MKNHREFSGIFANALIVVLVLVFIVFGLNKIGVYDLPDFVEKLLGTYEGSNTSTDSNDGKNESQDIEFDGSKDNKQIFELDYTRASKLLENLKAKSDYSHEISYSGFFDGISRNTNLSLTRKRNLYCVYVVDDNNRVVKEITETENGVMVLTRSHGEVYEAVFEKGDFDISDECGFVLTAEEFLSSGYELSDAEFSMFEDGFGTAVKIAFDKTMGGITQHQEYVISLDFGVVTNAICYENSTLVYSMSTNKLSA